MDIRYSFSNRAWYVRHVDFIKNEENNNGISWVNLSVLSELIFFPRYFYQKLFNRPSQKVIYFTTFDVISAPITIEYCVIWSSGCNNIINIIDVTDKHVILNYHGNQFVVWTKSYYVNVCNAQYILRATWLHPFF